MNAEELISRLNEQLHEKDMKLTDVRLEALSSAHQREQLREMLSRMKVRRLHRVAPTTGRNTTGPPCSRGAIIRPEAAWRHRLACTGEAACRPAVECYRRRQTTADDSDRY